VQEISDRTIKTTTGTFAYDRLISTIPLDALCGFLKRGNDLKARDVWVYQIQTDQLDFEGADEVLVVDGAFDFYKCYQIGRVDYQFFCLNEVLTPVEYFGAFTNQKLKVASTARTKVSNAIPMCVDPPNLQWLDTEYGIQCIGSNAQWDDMVDINTCISRVLKIRSA
jgi:hypothetical protein